MPSKKHQSPIESNNAFMVKIEDLVREIVIQNSIPYYRIESGMEHQAHYPGGEDTYLPVIRIITYFEDTVSQISDTVRNEFDIAIEKSIDKKKIRVDSFSYKHAQYIAGLKENRRELTEYKRYGNKKFEIQVCSMLQDAWTGIEKELGYDNASFPEETKRDFYRVGALLEMADIEFCKIRSLLAEKGYPTRIPQPAAVNGPMETVETPNTFSDYLQAVSKDAPAQTIAKEVPVQPIIAEIPVQPIVKETPVQAAVNEIPIQAVVKEVPVQPVVLETTEQAVVKEAPVQPVAIEPIQAVPEMPVISSAPVQVAQPLVVHIPATPVAEAVPEMKPVFSAPPVVTQPQPAPAEKAPKTVNVFAATMASLIPVRAIPSTPAKTPTGLAPLRVKAPVVNMAEAAPVAMSANGNKPSALNFTVAEIKKDIEEKVAPIISAVAEIFRPEPIPQPEPQAFAGVPAPEPIVAPLAFMPVFTPPVAEVPKAPQPAPAIPVPVQEPIRQEPVAKQEPVALSYDNLRNLSVNTNGIVEKAAEIVREPEKAAERVIPYFEDPTPKATKPSLLDENAPMNDASLREFVMTSKLLKEVDQKIAERAGAKINPEIDIEGDVERMRFLKVFTLKQLQDRIMDNKNDIVAFAEKWIGKDNGGSFDSGICLFYLEYLLVGKKNDPAFAIEYVVKFISDNDYSARYIIPTYNSIRNTEVSNFSHLTLKV